MILRSLSTWDMDKARAYELYSTACRYHCNSTIRQTSTVKADSVRVTGGTRVVIDLLFDHRSVQVVSAET